LFYKKEFQLNYINPQITDNLLLNICLLDDEYSLSFWLYKQNSKHYIVTLKSTTSIMNSREACMKQCATAFEASYNCAEMSAKSNGKCWEMCRACSEMCQLCSKLMAMESKYAQEACQLCAKMCAECASVCSKHNNDHCQRCAQECQRCADCIMKK